MSFTKTLNYLARSTLYTALALATLVPYGCGKPHSRNRPNNSPQTQEILEKSSLPNPEYLREKQEEKTRQKNKEDLEERLHESGVILLGNNETKLSKKYNALEVTGRFQTRGVIVGRQNEQIPAYLFFDGSEHQDTDLPYLSFGTSKLIIGVPTNQVSPFVEFLPQGNYLETDSENQVFVRAIGGKKPGNLRVEKRAWEGNISRITASSGYTIFSGPNGIKYDDEINREFQEPRQIPNNLTLNPSSPKRLHVITTDKIGQRLHEKDVVFDDYGSIAFGDGRELTSYPFSLTNGVYTSIRQEFHDLSKDFQEQRKLQAITKASNNRNNSLRDNTNTGNIGGDGYSPSMKNPKIPSQKASQIYKGEEYKKEPNSNKFNSRTGKFFIVN